MKNMKRIHKVTIKRMIDESPDTSCLGEYSNKAASEYAIDRAHSLDCISNTGCVWNKMPHVLYECGICSCLHPWRWEDDCRDDANRYADSGDYAEKHGVKDLDVTVVSWEDRQKADEGCDCGERGDMGRNELRYFNPCYENYKGPEESEIRKYCRQDYERTESGQRGDWCFIGIRAEAEYSVGLIHGDSRLMQEITSGGLWGIESDLDANYLKSIEDEELAELRKQLEGIGFSKRAICAALKDVERTEA